MNQVPVIPDLVRRAFRLPAEEAVHLGRAWNNGWKVGSFVLSPVQDSQYCVRTASIRACLQVPGLHIARPIRASDGRFVFSGWQATQYIPGRLTRRADEHVALALRLDKALKEIPVSTVFNSVLPIKVVASPSADLSELFARADALAWSEGTDFLDDAPLIDTSEKAHPEGESPVNHGDPVSGDLSPEPAFELAKNCIAAASGLRSNLGDNYLCHGDLVNSVVTEGSHQHTLTDFFPLQRPMGYSAALAIVDNLIAENAGLGLLRRYRHIPNIEILCLRAAAYRLLIHSGLQRRGLAQSSNIVLNLQKIL